jgi:hypothetical protein
LFESTVALDGGSSLTRLGAHPAHDRVVMRKLVGIGFAALVALVVAGFILGGYLDATGASSVPGLPWLIHQPQPLGIVIELAIGVPIAFGLALYIVLETVDLLWFLSTPIRRLSAAARRR